jgi:hypothetical protein
MSAYSATAFCQLALGAETPELWGAVATTLSRREDGR